jgi:hypothetical protein
LLDLSSKSGFRLMATDGTLVMAKEL